MGTVEVSDGDNRSETSGHRHLAIAGTGRAGTSFLVKYLTELGLDTTLSRQGADRAFWDEQAHAGLEEMLVGDLQDLPYVVKSPWMFQNIDQLLAKPDFGLDGVIIPIRSLTEAATSRIVNELYNIQHSTPWMAETDKTWEVWSGTAAGGVLFSLNPIDQARILAVGFHKLIEALVAADVPVYLLSFPRLIEDADYLFDRLQPALPEAVTRDRARLAHAKTADPDKIRVGREIEGAAAASAPNPIYAYPKVDLVDSIALKRELSRVRRESEISLGRAQKDIAQQAELIGTLERELKLARDVASELGAKIAHLETGVEAEKARWTQANEALSTKSDENTALITRSEELEGALRVAILELGKWKTEAGQNASALAQANEALSTKSDENTTLTARLEEVEGALRATSLELGKWMTEARRTADAYAAILNTGWWRLTAPFRRLLGADRHMRLDR